VSGRAGFCKVKETLIESIGTQLDGIFSLALSRIFLKYGSIPSKIQLIR
jgi:hypothetical protein